MIEKRYDPSCLYDDKSNSIFVIGGWGENGRMKSTEKLRINENMSWETTTDLPESLVYSAAVASNSNKYIGFVTGGYTSYGLTDKVWGLRRTDIEWVEMPKRLQKSRRGHTMVNVASEYHLC